MNLPSDVSAFADKWLANPAARFDFARLLKRATTVEGVSVNLREWIAQEENKWKRLGGKS